MYHDQSWGECLVSTLVLGAMFYATDKMARNRTLKEIDEKNQKAEIAELKRKLDEMERRQGC